MKHTTLAALCMAVSLALAAPAHADDQSFLAYFQAHGPATPYAPAKLITGGHMICTNLHNGADPMEGVGAPWFLAGFGPAIVDAAQHELCPETLH